MNTQMLYTQQELDSKLLAAANALRGPVDPADFKAYIFPLLFLKRVSDNWLWEFAKALELYDGDDDLARLPENFRFVVPEGCLWDDVLALHENVGAALQLIFDRLQEANPETLAGVFGTVQWANKQVLPEERLLLVLDVFTSLRLDPDSVTHDLLGNAYEYLLKNFADESGKKAGEFFTPRAVVRLMVRILDPQEGESIYDPACGSGGMLVESVNQVRAHGQDPRTLRLYGQEVQATTAAIARMNLYLHDIETFSIKGGDTLRDPRFRESDGALTGFDAVIANPPFSLKNWGRPSWVDDPFGRSRFGVPSKSYGDLAFVEHMVCSMSAVSGRLAVVMPQGALFRGGSERDIRRGLINEGYVEAVVDLPPNLFYSTTIPASVLVCRTAPRKDLDEKVLFLDISQRFKKGSNQNEMRPSDVDVAVSSFFSPHVDPPDGVHVHLASREEIAAKKWDLTPSKYIEREGVSAVAVAEAFLAFRESLRAMRQSEDSVAELVEGVESLFAEAKPEALPGVPAPRAQARVAELLGAVEVHQRTLAEATETNSALLDALTQEFCPTSRQSHHGTPVRELAAYINGRAFKPSDFTPKGLPVIRIRQLLDRSADVDRFDGSYDAKHFIDDGDLIFSWSATLAVVRWDRGPALLNQHLFKVVEKDEVDRGWLTYVLRSALVHFRQMTHGTTMKHITRAALSDVFVMVPSPEEQREIAATLLSLE
jgi:type I restriction enzyme M protein